jgi:hypothetical protein
VRWAFLLAACAETPVAVEEGAPKEMGTETFEAILDMDRLESGKGFQGTWLVTPNERIVVAYDPVPDYYRYVEKRVVVTGERYMPGRYEQHIMAPHFRLGTIALAAGEVAGADELPIPPLATGLSELEARVGKWVEIRATVESIAEPKDGAWWDGRVRIDDGTIVATTVYVEEAKTTWAPLVGGRATLLGRVARDEGALRLQPFALCPGEARGCGMR